MKSFLLSWLARKYSGADLAAFERDLPEQWLVWEAGPWRPPPAGRVTMMRGPEAPASSAGESLAVALGAKGAGQELRLGRAPENDIVLDDGTLSRQHLVLRRAGAAAWTVEDAGSSNGTRVNGMRLGAVPVRLEPGARIEAGAVRLTYYDAAALFLRLRGA